MTACFSGELTFASALAFLKQIDADSEVKCEYDFLVDFRALNDVTLSLDEVKNLVLFVKNMKPRKGRSAIISPAKIAYYLYADLYSNYCDLNDLKNRQVFFSDIDAETWLTQQKLRTEH